MVFFVLSVPPPLAEFVARLNKKRWHQIAEIGIEVASALSHSHEKEILHRDIKPSNLILDPDGKVWVTDFGLAKFMVNEATATNGIVGTLRFMPPERFRGWADPRSDIYSLGATLYELATLQKAYPENDRSLLISKIIDNAIHPIKNFHLHCCYCCCYYHQQ